jgi:TonB-linked SusC/RagA family outer membrane protein
MQLNALCKNGPRYSVRWFILLLLNSLTVLKPACKTLLCMKITALLLLAFCLQVSASTMAQNITLSAHKAPLEKVLNEIRQQSGYLFFYNEDWMAASKPVDLNVKNTPLEQVLKACFSDQPYTYEVVDKTIVLKPKEPSLIDRAKAYLAQTTITGKVTDELGNPMLGVTVRQKGTNNATATDVKGAYTLTVPDDKTIITFSFIGYETIELAAKDVPNGSVITLKAIATNLHEVLVSKGYYTERQELLTGNVSIVKGEDIQKQPGIDPIAALEGRVPGLYVTQSSGIPGANETVRLRGVNSIANGNDPLYIIDGVQIQSFSLTSSIIGSGALGGGSTTPSSSLFLPTSGMSPFSAINPADIESIEVLKDADATAIYGSRGANGVILITTKKGKAGDTRVNLDISQGIGQVTRMIDLLNTQQYLAMRHEAFKNDGKTPGATDYDINGAWDTTRNTNWQKALIGNTARYTNAQVSISGGTENNQFSIGGGYNRQTTVFPGDFSDQKGSMHISLNHSSANRRFNAQFSASYLNDNSNLPGSDLTGTTLNLAPDAPALYKPDGSLNFQPIGGSATFGNPLAPTLINANSVTNNLTTNLNLSYNILPGLQIKSSFGYSDNRMNQTTQTPGTSVAPPNNTNPTRRTNNFGTSEFNTWNIEPQISYERKISKGT